MKKFRKSPIAIVCYVFAAIFIAYFASVVVTTITTINEYYAAYGMSASFGEVVAYLFQQGLTPLVAAIVTCVSGIILEEVRKLNPANWATDEEIAEAKEAKRLAREAKQIAKGEAAKAAAENAADEAEDDDETIKAEFSAVVAGDEDTVAFDEAEETVAEEIESIEAIEDAEVAETTADEAE